LSTCCFKTTCAIPEKDVLTTFEVVVFQREKTVFYDVVLFQS